MEKWRFLKIVYCIQIIGCVCIVYSHGEQLSSRGKDPNQINWLVGHTDSRFLPKSLWKMLHNDKTIDSFLKSLPLELSKNSSKLESYHGMTNLLKKFSGNYNSRSEIREVLQTFKSDSMLLSNRCRSALDDLFKLFIKKKYLKIEQLLDAMGKPGSGVYQGNLLWLGSFQECQATDDSHYCTSLIKAMGYNVRFGLCVPKECKDEDTFAMLQIIASVVRNATGNKNAMSVDQNNALKIAYGSPVICQKEKEFSTGSIVVFVISAFLVFLVMLSTCLDYLIGAVKPESLYISKSNRFMPVEPVNETIDRSNRNDDDDQPLLAQSDIKARKSILIVDILLCFSLRKNASAILNTDVPPNAITSLNGIRTISMFWVILGHTFFFALFAGSDNIIEGFKIVHRFSFQAIANAYFSVDTFFVLSGLLVSYLCLRRFDNVFGCSFSRYFAVKFLPFYYLHRFLRLTPSYMYVIIFYIFIFPYCGYGPLWFEQGQGPGIQQCKNYWWTNLLYINNFYPKSMGAECIGWSWYLSNDMQFYAISPIILYLMYKLGVPGAVLINGSICVLSFLATGLIIGTKHLNALLTGDFQAVGLGNEAANFADMVYSKPYCRIPPYLVGLALGSILHHQKAPRGGTKYVICIIGWVCAIPIAVLAVYGPYTQFKVGGQPFNDAENIVYGTFSRFAWGLCVAWVIYACHFDMAGIVNSILSWKAFIPLSRLTYSAYLVHPIVIYVFYYSLEKPFHFSDFSIVYYYASFILMTYSSAFVLSAFVEFPAMNLEKLVFHF